METKHKQLKPFDKVLAREGEKSPWRAAFYSHYDPINFHHYTTGGPIKDVIPYEGNECFLGIIEEPDEEVKLEEGECVICFDDMECFNKSQSTSLSLFKYTIRYQFFTIDNQIYKYAIRFSDFNPNDMEETRKHILCVKCGRVVRLRYKV